MLPPSLRASLWVTRCCCCWLLLCRGQGAPAIFPLFVAASKGFTEVVEALLAAGAKPDMVNVVSAHLSHRDVCGLLVDLEGCTKRLSICFLGKYIHHVRCPPPPSPLYR